MINSNYEKKKRDLESTKIRNELYHIFFNNCIANSVGDDLCKGWSDLWND